MALNITDARAISMCDNLVDAFDNSASAPTLVIYSGAPAGVNAAAGTALVTLDLDTTAAFGGAAMSGNAAVATLAGLPVSGTIAATGTAGHFRMLDDAGTVILEGTVGTTATDLVLDTVSLVSGATFQITSLTLSVPTGA